MNILAVVHHYPPGSLVGAWLATHRFLRHLADRGHQVTVFAHRTRSAAYTLDGVHVETGLRGRSHAFRLAEHADLLISHCGDQGLPAEVHDRRPVPHVRLAHGHGANDTAGADLVVFNSEAFRSHIPHTAPSIVCHPPVDPAEHRTTPGSAVTIVNCSRDKGIKTAWQAAELLPDVEFLGVRGGYGEQVIPRCTNFEVIAQTRDMRTVWSRTRILLVPSIAEAWGMVAVEAMASGIPVIAHPTPGLRESLGAAGVFVDRDDPDSWAREIRRLLDPDEWATASARATARSGELDPVESLTRFANAVEALASVAA